MQMEMGLLRVPDESGCKGLLQWRRKCLALRHRHMSLFAAVTSAYRPQMRYNNRLQSSLGRGRALFHFRAHTFSAAITTCY